MTPEHFQRLEVLFHEAIELDPILQQGWIDAHCEDGELRRALASLIAHHNREGIIDVSIELTPAATPNPVGLVLDRKYRIEHELGRGGMGNVFLATHLGTERPVAVKIIRPEFSANAEYLARFKREAIAAGKLRHPNIVNVTDFGVAPFGSRSVAFLVMEYLIGQSLADRLSAVPELPLDETLDILDQTCAAVGAAHDLGIIHRDLKPENIWLQPDGRGGTLVKVLDFGLAKFSDGQEAALPANALFLAPPATAQSDTRFTNHATLLQEADRMTTNGAPTAASPEFAGKRDFENTMAGAVMGTPLYMSPEQCAGKKVDRASDIYSLGVIAYRMLAGETPFSGDMFQLMLKHREEFPEPLARKRRDIPPGVAMTVMRALAKTPAARPVSAAAFATALRVHAEGDAAIIFEADRLWRAHRATLMKLTARVALPGLLLTTFLMTAFIQRWGLDFPYAWVLQAGVWILPFIILRGLTDLVTAGVAHAVPVLRANRPVNLAAVAADIRRERLAIFRLGLKMMCRPRHLLAIPAALADGFPLATTRSERRLAGLLPFAHAIVAKRRAQYCGLLLAGTIACIPFLVPAPKAFWTNFSESLPPVLREIRPDMWGWEMIACFAVLTGYALFRLPKPALEIVVLHETARAIAGETRATALPRFSADARPRLELPAWLRLPISRTWVETVLVTWWVTYVFFIPPMGPLPKIERRHYARISEADNAWPEYRIALRRLGGEDQRAGLQHGAIENYAFQDTPLTDEIRTILDDNQDAFRHLLAGAKQARFQLVTEENGTRTPAPNLLAVDCLVNLTAAEARRLDEKGEANRADELRLAAFRMSTDFAEEGGNFLALLVSQRARALCFQMFERWLRRGAADAQRTNRFLRRMADIDARMPVNPFPFFDNDMRQFQQLIEDSLVNTDRSRDVSELFEPDARQTQQSLEDSLVNAELTKELFDRTQRREILVSIDLHPYTAGFRFSVHKGFSRYWKRHRATVEEFSRDFDFPGLQQWIETHSAYAPGAPPLELASTALVSETAPNWYSGLRTHYRGLVRARGTLALLACDVYQKRHGAFPAKLETAFEECGVSVPVDPVTGRPPGYRLADGVPEVWFVGFDRKDDGGLIPYSLEKDQNRITPGSDFLMRYGQPVAW